MAVRNIRVTTGIKLKPRYKFYLNMLGESYVELRRTSGEKPKKVVSKLRTRRHILEQITFEGGSVLAIKKFAECLNIIARTYPQIYDLPSRKILEIPRQIKITLLGATR